jgi:hypothetical protein
MDGSPSANLPSTEANDTDGLDMSGISIEPVDDDPSLADWFKVNDKNVEDVRAQQNLDTETDDDSDNADVNANDDEERDDDWFNMKPADADFAAVCCSRL